MGTSASSTLGPAARCPKRLYCHCIRCAALSSIPSMTPPSKPSLGPVCQSTRVNRKMREVLKASARRPPLSPVVSTLWVLGGVLGVLAIGCDQGSVPDDYAPAALAALGIHQAPVYTARNLMSGFGLDLLISHPRLGQPVVRQVGEAL